MVFDKGEKGFLRLLEVIIKKGSGPYVGEGLVV